MHVDELLVSASICLTLFSCLVIFISVLYIIQLSCHKTTTDYIWIVWSRIHHSFTYAHQRESYQEVFSMFQTLGLSSLMSDSLSFFWVFVFKRVLINALGPKCRWINSFFCNSSLFGWGLASGGRILGFHTAFFPPEHTNECFLHSCPQCPVTQAAMKSYV